MNDVTIANQQAKEVDLAWLAGIIDGEGSILLCKSAKRQKKGGHTMAVKFHITNTCCNIISKSEQIFDDLGIGAHLYTKERPQDYTRWAVAYRLDINKFMHVKRLLEAVMPYLISKRGQAELILRFIDRRIGRGRLPYDKVDESLIQEFNDKYRKGYLDASLTKASETKRGISTTQS